MAFLSRSRRGPLWIRLVLIVVVLCVIGYRRGFFQQFMGDAGSASGVVEVEDSGSVSAAPGGAADVERYFQQQRSGQEVEVRGRVERALSDDTEGSPHQRFIIELATGRTLLVAHNLDLAQRVPLEVGDLVEARGEYEWNEQGGVLHWTHHDPQGQRPGGWILHDGTRYR